MINIKIYNNHFLLRNYFYERKVNNFLIEYFKKR
jgi:hypothetical protein